MAMLLKDNPPYAADTRMLELLQENWRGAWEGLSRREQGPSLLPLPESGSMKLGASDVQLQIHKRRIK